ncbi:hypothetical protein DRO97_09340 [Archaeoglobales archaeon]|nr:MAG: hypothetical protein DRO97_09340 [Archaeoglobales archaeon]
MNDEDTTPTEAEILKEIKNEIKGLKDEVKDLRNQFNEFLGERKKDSEKSEKIEIKPNWEGALKFIFVCLVIILAAIALAFFVDISYGVLLIVFGMIFLSIWISSKFATSISKKLRPATKKSFIYSLITGILSGAIVLMIGRTQLNIAKPLEFILNLSIYILLVIILFGYGLWLISHLEE